MITHRFLAFGGAQCSVMSLDGDETAVSNALAETYAFESILTRFNRNSELSKLNAAGGGRVTISPLLEAVLRAALHAFEISDGLVNAACGAALNAAGYDRTISAVQRSPRPARSATPPPPLPEVLSLGRGWAQLRTGTLLDLGGVGKGWLADLLIERFDNGVVNLGGDVRIRGGGESGAGWLTRLCNGRSLWVTDAGVATSGIGSRRWDGGHHIIDPRTGEPGMLDLETVSVVAPSALDAEVLAKGALLCGAAAAPAWLAIRHISDFATIGVVAA